MFIFASILIAATWFAARLLWDRALRPGWRFDPARRRRRFVCITATGAALATSGFGAVVASLYSPIAGLVAATALAPVYCLFGAALFVLLSSFGVDP